MFNNDNMVEHIKAAMRQSGSIGIFVGILISREVLHRAGIDPEITTILDHEVVPLLKKVATGELVLQDQVTTGQAYNPDVEQTFREYAQEFVDKPNGIQH